MSRLLPHEIEHICGGVADYDRLFQKQTGKTMNDLCRELFGIAESAIRLKTAVVPITSGLGTIERFSQSVCAILRHIGADAFVTEKTDVFGFQEAYLNNADIIFAADDNAYVAFSTQHKTCSDNGFATGVSFAAALDNVISCRDKTVLVLGAGPVGSAGCRYLAEHGAMVKVFDPVYEKSEKLCGGNIEVLHKSPELKQYRYVLDATPVGNWITEESICENAVYSAPGMPLSLTESAAKKITLIHNPLELGTVAMYYDCISRFGE